LVIVILIAGFVFGQEAAQNETLGNLVGRETTEAIQGIVQNANIKLQAGMIVTSLYGAAGSVITILLWMYYSARIFLLGAEFTEVYAREYGSGIVSSQHAQRRPGRSKEAGVVMPDRPSQGPNTGTEDRLENHCATAIVAVL
jgi:uncharacterized BrkB/YihY/UPF0761 family membrane protein